MTQHARSFWFALAFIAFCAIWSWHDKTPVSIFALGWWTGWCMCNGAGYLDERT